MAIDNKKDEKINNNNRNTKNNSRRRRKKRRTEDFSSDSDSSSSSDEEVEQVKEDNTQHETKNVEESMDIDITSDDESKNIVTLEALNNNVYKNLSNIKLSAPLLADANSKNNGLHSKESKEVLVKDRTQLNTEYLKLMTSNFGDDLDELRKKPDFTDKSLVLLAKTLQSGGNMFDEETLNVLFNS